MAKSSNYWDKRAIKRLTDAEKQSEVYVKRILKMYDNANKNILRDIENIYANYSKATGLDVQSLKTLLTKTETKKLWEELKRKGLDKYDKDNYKARISRLEKLQAQIYAKAKEIYPQEQLEHTMCYEGIINNSYYKTIYDTQMGTGFDFAFSNIDDNMVTALLNERWSGKNYSQRIWGNTDILAQSVSEVIGGAMLSGQSIQKTARQIRERFDVGKFYAQRLVRTEVNHFNNEADAMAYEEMDVDKYVFLATLDTRTSTICQELDNQVFELKKRRVGENYPPMHPNCRSKTRAYMGEEIERTLKRRARNPITGKNEVIDNMSYKEWAEKHGLNREQYRRKDSTHRKTINGKKIIDKPTYNKLTKEFLKHDGIIIRGERADSHLKDGNSASYVPGMNVAFIRDNATISDVLEEMYHAKQDRMNMYGDNLTAIVIEKREIDAQKYLISVEKRYKIPLEEMEQTKANLKYHEKLLAELLKAGEK